MITKLVYSIISNTITAVIRLITTLLKLALKLRNSVFYLAVYSFSPLFSSKPLLSFIILG